jgi:BRCT domain type II-containing protein
MLLQNVELVVLGEKAGPKKLQDIEKHGLETTTWEELIEEIKLEEGNADAAGKDDEMEEDDDEDDAEEVSQCSVLRSLVPG